MSIQDKRIFKKLNTDSDPREMDQGDYRYALNCRTSVTDKGHDGAVENVPGNIEIVNPNLPSGSNKCLGAYEDKKGNTIIFFNWNSNSNHGIYRYYPDQAIIDKLVVNSRLNFKEFGWINSIDLIGNLLYWGSDGINPPRKINIEKASVLNKKLKSNVYFVDREINENQTTTNSVLSYLVVLTPVGSNIGVPYNLPINPLAPIVTDRDMQYIADQFVDLWNNNSDLYSFGVASSCNGYASIERNAPSDETVISVSVTLGRYHDTDITLPLKTVADNYYPSANLFRDDFIQRVKYPFNCEPSVSSGRDITRAVSLIEDGVFQFRTQIVYDDNEQSALSPISVIPVIPSNCGDDSSQTSYNYISVDFNDSRINDESVLSIIKYVNIYVRNGNLGKFGFVASLTREQFLSFYNTYKFYNDGLYPAIDDALSNKPYDSVPLLNDSQVIADDRIFDGGLTEGYDPVCIEDKLTVAYESAINSSTFSIKGKLFIKNLFGAGGYADCQPIISHDNGGSDFGFGGVGPALPGNLDIIWSDYGTYKQQIPLKGFVVYLSGTEYRSVTVQNIDPYLNFPTGSGSSARNARKAASAAVQLEQHYQQFSIDNVPPGKYIMRIASHLTTQDELNSGSLEWQKSSTNTLAVGGVVGTECLLEVLSNGDIVIGANTYTNGSPIADTFVADLTHVGSLNVLNALDSFVVCGYVCGNDTANTGVNILKDTRIHLARITMDHYANGQYNSFINSFGLSGMIVGDVKADHNGYFFFTTNRPSVNFPTTLNYSLITSNNNNLSPTAIKIDGGVWSGRTSPGAEIGIFRNTSSTVNQISRTVMRGKVTSNGSGVPNISVRATGGGEATTDSQGDYSMYLYAYNTVRSSNIVYNVSDTCFSVFSPNPDYINIGIAGAINDQTNFSSPYSGTYDVQHSLRIVDSVATLSGGSSTSSLKRGGKYRFGKVYYDAANRQTVAITSEDLNLSIPFFTQRVNGVQVAGGKAIVDWDVYNLPPEWATHWQWVRTLNGNQQKLLQFTAKTVSYVDDTGSVVPFNEATNILVNLENITDYKTAYPASQLSYTFEEGDRLVLIRDVSGNLFNNYYDFKIRASKTGSDLMIYIDNVTSIGELKPGVFFEVYNPRKALSDEFFYEIGECFPVLTNRSGIKVHGGLSVNQEYWMFNDNFFVSGGYVGFTGSERHSFSVGDTIKVYQDPGYAFPQYNTTGVVTAITSTTVSTNIPWQASSPVNPGYIVRAAHGRFRNGDTWNRLRNIPYRGDNDATKPSDKFKIWPVEDYSISDFYSSESQSIGRPTIASRDIGRLYRPSAIRFSNRYIQDTKVNGLSTNEALNEKVLPANYGSIRRLIYTKTTLLAIHENSQIVSMEINKQTFRDTGNQQLVAVAESVLPTDYEYQGSLGTQNPESVFKDDDDFVHGIDVNKGVVWTRQVNGLVPISEIDMSFYFRQKCNDIKNAGLPSRIPGYFDRAFNQVVWTFNEVKRGDSVLVSAETIGFSKKDRVWESFYSFIPENYGIGRNTEVVAFKEGRLWRQGVNPVYNNFFGIQYTSKIQPVFNVQPSVKKVFINMSVESSRVWSAPDIKTLEGQVSKLNKNHFEEIEGVFYADIMKDILTKNTPFPLINGNDLRSAVLIVMMENDSTELCVLYATNIYSITSEKTNRT